MHEPPTTPPEGALGESQADRFAERRARLKAQISNRRSQLAVWEEDWTNRLSDLERKALNLDRDDLDQGNLARTIAIESPKSSGSEFESLALARLDELQTLLADEQQQIALLRNDFSEVGSLAERTTHRDELHDQVSKTLASHSELIETREARLREREDALEHEREEVASRRLEAEAALQEAAAAQALCDKFKRDWEAAVAAIETERKLLAEERKAIATAQQSLAAARQEFELTQALADGDHDARLQSQVAELTARLEASQSELTRQREELTRVWAELATAQSRSQDELAAERKLASEAHVAVSRLQTLFADEKTEFQQRLDQLRRDHERELHGREEQWKAELERYIAQAAELRIECDDLREAVTLAKAETARSAKLEGVPSAQWDERHQGIVNENAALKARLDQAEQAASQVAMQAIDRREVDELRRRFELAVQDVRELKHRNSELTSELNRAREKLSPSAKPVAGYEKLDWESRKRQLLEQLEAEGDIDDPNRKAERLSIESTIRITDEVIAEKDRELADKEGEVAELQRILENQSNNLGGVAVGAAAIAQMLDQDSLVVQERERLKELQEAVKQNEIALSVERAQMARMQQELQAKLAEVESLRSQKSISDTTSGDKKKSSSNWMARLGLRDNNGS